MFSKIYNYWQILKGNLWFFPALTCIIYAVSTLLLYHLESRYFRDIVLPGVLFNGSADDAKAMSVTLLSSMITMTTLAISITMVVLSLAASQLGPRLIRTFMADQKTKMFIALFFGAVISCFLLVLILYDASPQDYTPKITITTIFALCFATLFVLLAFVHHVAQSSIADQVILKVAKDLHASLDRLTVSDGDDEHEDPDHSDWPKNFEQKRQRLYFERSGYVQHIDYDHLLSLAHEHGLFIRIKFKAGHFLVEGEDGVRVYPKHKVTDELNKTIRERFILGDSRTPTQDVEYSIRHLVEIGLRAQSPGQDDDFTAITVLDRLSAALAILFQKQTPSEWMEDQEGRVRIWAKQSDEADIIFSALDQIRQSARDKPDIMFHFLDKLKILCELARTPAQVKGLRNQIVQIEYDLGFLNTIVRTVESKKKFCSELHDILDRKQTTG